MLSSASASAQSAIAGVVRDTTGAVMPGVTVEASSPALIEKVKSVTTDEAGLYRIIDLRPGTYVVTFGLAGFNTVRREGIELPSDFTATVNADMRVGALEETVTVTGASPVVDIKSSTAQQVLSRDILDAVPTGRNIWALGSTLTGITLTAPAINHAAHVVFIVTGESKARRLADIVRGPRDPERLPSQAIQPLDGSLEWFVDKAAAGYL